MNYTFENNEATIVNNISIIKSVGSDDFSCQKMKYDEIIFTCFYQNNNSELTAINYNITDNQMSIISSTQQSNKNNGANFIKSILSLNKTKSLVCFINNDNNIDCLIYNITDNTFSESKTYLTGCLSKYSSINIEYLDKLMNIYYIVINLHLNII